MAKISALDKAIANIEGDIAVLELAKAKLVLLRVHGKTPARRPRIVAKEQAG